MKLLQLTLRDLFWTVLVAAQLVVAQSFSTARAADIEKFQDNILKANQRSADGLDIAVRLLLRATHLGKVDDSWWTPRLDAPQRKAVESVLKCFESKMKEVDKADDRGPIDFLSVDAQLTVVDDPVGLYEPRIWASSVLRTEMSKDWIRTGRPDKQPGAPAPINNVDPLPCIRCQYEFHKVPFALARVDEVGMDRAVREFVEINPITAQIVIVWRGKDTKSKKKYFAVVSLVATAEGWKETLP